MSIKIVYDGNKVSVDKAIKQLKEAYESKEEERIATALEEANETIKEHNRLLRRDFYLSKITSDNTESRKAILAGGYIGQIKLVNKIDKAKNREIDTAECECPVNVLEVNRLVRKEIFGDDIEYRCQKFRAAVVAYASSECGKSSEELEKALGYASLNYLASSKTSMNNMAKLLQNAIDEILFVKNDKGENALLAKKTDVKTIALWIATKTPRYGTKYASTDGVLKMIVDIIWAKLNNITLTMKMDDVEF